MIFSNTQTVSICLNKQNNRLLTQILFGKLFSYTIFNITSNYVYYATKQLGRATYVQAGFRDD